MNMENVFEKINSYERQMYDTLMNVVRIKALAPENEGDGELEKAKYLVHIMREMGFEDVKIVKAPDKRVSAEFRPNIIALVAGKQPDKGTIWSVAHTDVVPEGDMKLWDTDPYEPVETEDRIIGRGVEDNTQSLIASLFAAKAILDTGFKHDYNIGLAFVADEEVGSTYGIKYLVKNTQLFNKEKDLILVPDFGLPDGSFIEISEKSIMWLKVTTIGKQCHASSPDQGNNANRAAMKYLIKADEMLHSKYNYQDDLFDPPESTFEPTRRLPNVGNINTIPGEDISFFDMRILPDYDPEDILRDMKELAFEIEKEFNVTITVEKENYDRAAPPTPADAPIVTRLMDAIRYVYRVEPKPGGIGGGTCGAIFRRAGFNAAVWSRIAHQAHAPNEFIYKKNLMGDCKVFAALFAGV